MSEILKPAVGMRKTKKRFGANTKNIAKAISQGEYAELNTKFRNALISCEDIILDEFDPRDLALTPHDVLNGLNKASPDFTRKANELEKIKSLSESIKKDSLLQPIVVYKNGEKYQIVAGERRYLASLLAKIESIEARVYIEKPSKLTLKLAQWVENNQREDLSLVERIENIRDLIITFEEQNNRECKIQDLVDITGLSTSQCGSYYQAMRLKKDVLDHIKDGVIDNLDKALFLNNAENALEHKTILDLIRDGEPLKAIRQKIKEIVKIEKNKETKTTSNTRINKKLGRKSNQVNLGITRNVKVIKEILSVFLKNEKYKTEVEKIILNDDIEDFDSASLIFQDLIKLLETKV